MTAGGWGSVLRDSRDPEAPQPYPELREFCTALHPARTAEFMEGLTAKPNVKVDELMERDIVTVNAHDDREEVADKVERYDLLAIPVVDDEYRLVGIITHDDVIDVLGIIIYMNVAWWMFLYPALPTPVP